MAGSAQRPPDDRDRQLLALLQANARTPVAEIARRLKLSRNAVQQRIARLERDGVIRGYSVITRRPHEDRLVRAIVLLRMTDRKQNCRRLARELGGWPEIESCQSVAGPEDISLVVRAPSTEELSNLLIRLAEHERISHVSSYIILETVFDRGPVP
jgi:DNA-binding Lrp family transcriptional regulator